MGCKGISKTTIPPLMAALAAFLVLATWSHGAASEETTPSARNAETITAIDELMRAGRVDSVLAMSEGLVESARAGGDSAFLAELLGRRGSIRAGRGDVRNAESILREAVALAEAIRDTAALCFSLRWLTVAVSAQGRGAEATDMSRRLLELSRSSGDEFHEGWALVGLAWDAVTRGDLPDAVGRYRAAALIFERLEAPRGSAWTLNGLANALSLLGRYDEAREAYRRATEAAEGILADGMRDYVLSDLLNDLGALEFSLGDPGLAEERFRRALAIQRESGSVLGSIVPGLNVALCQSALGNHEEAASGLTTLAAECARGGFRDQLGKVLILLAEVRSRQGRRHEADSLYRRSLDLGDTLALRNRVEALIGISDGLAASDRTAEALDVLRSGRGLLEGTESVDLRNELDGKLGLRLFEAGRYEEALRLFLKVRAEEERLGLRDHTIGALAFAARACRKLGKRDSALVLLEEAAAVWEADRAVPLDPEWREQRGSQSRRVYTALAALILRDGPGSETERVRAAFDRLQSFKARTLLERMLGPGEASHDARVPDPVTLALLQRDVLGDGDLLLDAFLGPEESLLFAVTRDEARVARLPGDETLERKLRLFHELQSAHDGGGSGGRETRRRVAMSVSRQLLGEVPDLVANCRRILFAPDGGLNLLSLASLPEPSAVDSTGKERFEPLAASKEVVHIPSATFLGLLRKAPPAADAGEASRILAVASSAGDSGEPLRGAVDEVRALARHYENVQDIIVRGDTCSIPVDEMFGGYDILHLAAHARVDDQSPWRSTIRLCEADERSNPRADRIAGMRLSARLAVLSSCHSAGGRILSGEGVQGLSTAFLSAGVPAVVATLWAVDDQSTARLMSRFYRRLAVGNTVSRSLQLAQADLRRRFPDPYFWAGFVLVGDGGVRLGIERRSAPIGASGLVALFALLAVTGAGILGRRKARAARSGV